MRVLIHDMLTERQQSILFALVPEYIHHATPVGSEFLRHKHEFGVGPATIRNELSELTEKGYLEQPHTSAGRVPTDKGYRFYVDILIEERELKRAKKETKRKKEFFQKIEGEGNADGLESLLAKVVEEFSDTLVWGVQEGYNSIVFGGLRKALRQPEFQDVDSIDQFLAAFEYIFFATEEIVKQAKNTKQKVFIGKELQMFPSSDYALVISSFPMRQKKVVWTAFFGPKRMRYRENLELIEWLEEYFTA